MRTSTFAFTLAVAVASLLAAASRCARGGAQANPPREVRRIWDKAPHNAFTDLVRFNGRWFCAFREGRKHAGAGERGQLRVIASNDGQEWESVGLFGSPRGDMRDGKLSVSADNTLVLVSAMRPHEPAPQRHQSLSWLSADGATWSEAAGIGDPNIWIWGVHWHKGYGYGIGYRTVKPHFVRLYRTVDGRGFETHVPDLNVRSDYPNEGCIVFSPDETAYCLLRCGGPAQIGYSKPPYKAWTWKETKTPIGGPELIQLDDGRLLAGVRLYDGKSRSSLCWVDPESATITEAIVLPSGGDCSYPGMVLHDEVLWTTYYSSHEGKASIYLAQIGVDELNAPP